jgi:predicted anti-sigma-YlaC factor YlaD
MGCDDCRAAISAELDGEGPPGAGADVAAHLEHCPDCRRYADRAAHVTRLARTRVAEPVPDLVAVVLAAAPPPARRRAAAVRVGLGVLGIGQFALAVTGVLGTGDAEHHGTALAGASVAHFAHESSAWNLALAVGFLWAATGSARVGGLVPVVAAFVAVLSGLSLLDVLAGRVEPTRLLGHALVAVGLVLLVALRRCAPGGGGPARVGRSDPGAPVGERLARFGGRARRRGGDGGLAPTAHRRAA